MTDKSIVSASSAMPNSSLETGQSNCSPPQSCDVIVIGAGPSGLATATALKSHGVESVIVLDREAQAGGIPRHCGHPPFGMREFKRILTGPQYAAHLVDKARRKGVEIYLNCTVVALHEGGKLTLSTHTGVMQITARKVVLCTGVRETPRAPRLVSGQRPLGVSTTGALQSMVYLKGKRPFKRPVIVGSELVAFSALMTCKKANIKPVAMIEQTSQTSAYGFCDLLPKLMGVALYKDCQLLSIEGSERVRAVNVISGDGKTQKIECDGVLFTGQFTAESSLVRMSHITLDEHTGLPVVDQFGQCSDDAYFAAGNVLHPVETAGWCWREGVAMAANIAASLQQSDDQKEQHRSTLKVLLNSEKISYVTPQRLTQQQSLSSTGYFQLRFAEPVYGLLSITQEGKTLWSKKAAFLPHRRILIPFKALQKQLDFEQVKSLDIHFTEH